MIDPVLLRSFVMVVDTGNFTRAAESLHLTQSTVSQQVQRLEHSLDCMLLDRSQRQVLPTEAGLRLLGYARRILRLTDEAREALSSAPHDEVLRLGVPEDFAGEALMPHLAAFAADHPQLRLEVDSGLSHRLLGQFRGGELDLLLVKQWDIDADCDCHWPEPLCWISSKAHAPPATYPLWRERLPLVVFPEGALYRQQIIQALDMAQRPWRIRYESSSLANLCAAVSEGLGVSLVPASSVQAGHRVLECSDGFELVGPLKLALYINPRLTQAGRQLRDRLLAFCTERAARA